MFWLSSGCWNYWWPCLQCCFSWRDPHRITCVRGSGRTISDSLCPLRLNVFCVAAASRKPDWATSFWRTWRRRSTTVRRRSRSGRSRSSWAAATWWPALRPAPARRSVDVTHRSPPSARHGWVSGVHTAPRNAFNVTLKFTLKRYVSITLN